MVVLSHVGRVAPESFCSLSHSIAISSCGMSPEFEVLEAPQRVDFVLTGTISRETWIKML